MARFFITVAALLAVLAGMPDRAAARAWTLLDVAGVVGIDDVQISPSGESILVDVYRSDLAKNAVTTRYELVRADGTMVGSMPKDLTNPRWSPNGATIAWFAPRKNGTQRVVVTDASGKNPKPLSRTSRSVVRFAWSPDGSAIAAVETASGKSNGGERLRWMGKSNDFLDRQPPRRELWKIEPATGNQTRLTGDDWSYGGAAGDRDPQFSPDGRTVLAVRQPTAVFEDFDREEYVEVDVRTGKLSRVVDRAFFAYPGSTAPVWSPDGNDVAYVQSWDGKLPSRQDLFVGARDVTASLDRDLWSCGAGSVAWQRNALIVDLMDGASMRLFRIDPSSATATPLTGADGSAEVFSVARTGRIAYVWTTPEQLPEVYVLDPGGQPRRVTHLSSIPSGLPIAPTRYFEWTASDGHPLHGQLTLPTGADLKKTPIVMEPHGGPQCADDNGFNAFAQYLTSNGYAYFRPDPRGSDGYGDWSYKAIVDNWGPGPMADDLAGIDAVIASGVGNNDRLFIEGGSYGGYLTSWIVTHTDRFKAAVAQIPVTNLLLNYTLTEDANIFHRFFTHKPATVPQQLADQSPLTYASAERTPLLLILGLRDARAPYPQTIEFYKALLENGAPVRLLADPLAGHGPSDPKGAIAWFSATMGWIAAHGGIAIPDARLPL